jgi:CubicO group peptidase (beta-lactamase class C family)
MFAGSPVSRKQKEAEEIGRIISSGMKKVKRIRRRRKIQKQLIRAAQFAFTLLLANHNSQSLAAEKSLVDGIIGLWGTEKILPAAVRGELTIDGRKEWHAKASGLEVKAETTMTNAPAIVFNFPAGAGKLRYGTKLSDEIFCYWIQPANEINNNQYATPVELAPAGEKIWKGTLAPLQARRSIFLAIQRAANGSISAVIRNPEANLFRRNLYRVEVREGVISFVDVKDPNDKFQGKFDQKTQCFFARLPNFEKEMQFTRRKDEAAGFFARGPGNQTYTYHEPVPDSDGWATGSLTDAGLDPKPLSALIAKIVQADPINNSINIQSLLIARHGKLVLEEYFYGFDQDRPHDMRSASKTFAPLLLGIARDQGVQIGPETPVYSQFDRYGDPANPDLRKSKMTARDLMTMTSGLACDDNDDASPGNEDSMQQQKEEPDWYKYTLDLPLVRAPGGEKAVYCSAGINLLGGMVRHATNRWLPQFFHEYVAAPLQMKTYYWNLMPDGEGYAGGGVYMRPRDQLKLGQLYLAGGIWNGRRVVSKDWVEKSTSRQSSFEPIFGIDHDYGYGWHIYHLKSGDRRYLAYAAGGNGGQIVMVIPELDLVVGFTGGSYGEFAKWYKWQTELVPQFIIPAAASAKGR